MTTTELNLELPEGLGGVKPIQLPATRYKQGGRWHFHVAIPLVEIIRLVQRPDPNRPLQGNRKVDANRAKRFAEYLIRNDDWVSPAILLRVPQRDVEFVPAKEMSDGTAWGVLCIPPDIISAILLLDGQHRTLGVFIAMEMINDRIHRLRETIRMMEQQQADKELLKVERAELTKATRTRTRLSTEHVSVDLVEVGEAKAKQIFGDINNNALGVNNDFRTVLDQRDPVNRITTHVIKRHPLLKGRVEEGQASRMSANNENLIGAKSVADIVRGVLAGNARITPRKADEIGRTEDVSRDAVVHFLDLLTGSFPELQEVKAGKLTGRQLRQQTMLGSATMLRILAAVYHALVLDPEGPQVKAEKVATFFTDLAPHLRKIPVQDRLWLDIPGVFVEGGSAPQARQGPVKVLTETLASWALYGIPEPTAEEDAA